MHHDVSGVIPVAKPAGVTSRRVVDVVAKALGTRSVGHAGTLDPLATGVVVVCVGHATKLVDFVHELPKHYEGSFLLGRSSPSDDLETPVEEEPAPVRPSWAEIEAALPAFRGAILQRPCDYSAVHVAGQRAYRIARKGRPIELEAKPVRIERLEITGYEWPRLGLALECSSGTFVRAIGRDLAAALGTRAVMEALVRTAVGPFTLDRATALDDVTPESARAALLPPAVAVAHLPAVTLPADMLARAIRGDLLDIDTPAAAAALDDAGDLVGMLRRHEAGRHRLKPNFRGLG
ncbi:MAG: tRNA pseudouridine(55) synthase TruB [Planctomycetia bacterium]